MSEIVHSEVYRGKRIDIYVDGWAENPWESWDYMTPIAYYFRDNREILCPGEDLISIPLITVEQVLRSREWLTDVVENYRTGVGISNAELFENTTCDVFYQSGTQKEYPIVIQDDDETEAISFARYIDKLSDMYESNKNGYGTKHCYIIQDILREVRDYYDHIDRLNFMEEFWQKVYGYNSLAMPISGYSQGDYGYVLCVETEEFLDGAGLPARSYEEAEKNLRSSIKLFKDWAFGDVYGFAVVDTVTGNTEDSCGGIYGDYYEDGGALSHAKEDIDYRIKYSNKNHLKYLKKVIKSGVPFIYRKENENARSYRAVNA